MQCSATALAVYGAHQREISFFGCKKIARRRTRSDVFNHGFRSRIRKFSGRLVGRIGREIGGVGERLACAQRYAQLCRVDCYGAWRPFQLLRNFIFTNLSFCKGFQFTSFAFRPRLARNLFHCGFLFNRFGHVGFLIDRARISTSHVQFNETLSQPTKLFKFSNLHDLNSLCLALLTST
jgi:hypothetical protein